MKGYIPSEFPTDNVSGDGDLGHPGFNYSRHGMDNTRASASYRDHPTVTLLRTLSEVWLTMPIALFGVIGNVVSLVVLCYHRRLKKLRTIVIQLQALAVVDTLILLTHLLLRSFRYVVPVWYMAVLARIYPWMYPTVFVLRLLSVWLTVLLTVDRYIAVRYPLDARSWCTLKRTYIVMTCIALVTLAFSLPRYFEYTLKTFDSGHVGFVSTPLLNNKVYNIVYRISLFISVQYVLPTLALVYLNACVIVALRRSDTCRLSTVRHSPVTEVVTSQSTRSITVVVAVIVSICIIAHVTALTAHLLTIVVQLQTNVETSRRFEPAWRHLAQASNVLVTVNSAVNFIVYCMISREFRKLLVRHCCRCISSSSSAVARRHAQPGCCWPLGGCRHSDMDDSKRSTSAIINHSEPRTNLTTVHFIPAGQLTVAVPHLCHGQQQQQQQVELQ